MRAKLTSERESAARARQYAQERNHHLTAELDSLDARLRDVHRERDHLLGRVHNMQMDIERGIGAERRLASARSHIASLDGQIVTARAKRAEAEAELDRLRATMSTSSTAEELSKMVSNLEKDVASLKQSRDKYKAAADGAEAARSAAADAKRALAESQAKLETVRSRLDAARQEATGWAAERRAATEREEELRLFAEVAQTFLGATDNGEKVLSTTNFKLCFLAILANPLISATSSNGLLTVSQYNTLVVSVIAASTRSNFVISTKLVLIPKRGVKFFKKA